jgi:hypothetical protein
LKKCNFSLKSVSLSGAGLDHLDLKISILCENPSDALTVIIDPFDWVLKTKGHILATGTIDKDFSIHAQKGQIILIPARVSLGSVGKAAYESIRDGRSSFQLEITFRSPLLFFRIPHKFILEKG